MSANEAIPCRAKVFVSSRLANLLARHILHLSSDTHLLYSSPSSFSQQPCLTKTLTHSHAVFPKTSHHQVLEGDLTPSMTSLYAISIPYTQKLLVVHTTPYNTNMPRNQGNRANRSLSSNKGQRLTKQEPDVLSLAEYIAHRKTATTKDKYANTLLFNTTKAPWMLVVKTIERTKQQWEWFTQAKELDVQRDTTLGTLRYLPFEIRQQIHELVLDDHFRTIVENHDGSPQYEDLNSHKFQDLLKWRLHYQPG